MFCKLQSFVQFLRSIQQALPFRLFERNTFPYAIQLKAFPHSTAATEQKFFGTATHPFPGRPHFTCTAPPLIPCRWHRCCLCFHQHKMVKTSRTSSMTPSTTPRMMYKSWLLLSAPVPILLQIHKQTIRPQPTQSTVHYTTNQCSIITLIKTENPEFIGLMFTFCTWQCSWYLWLSGAWLVVPLEEYRSPLGLLGLEHLYSTYKHLNSNKFFNKISTG